MRISNHKIFFTRKLIGQSLRMLFIGFLSAFLLVACNGSSGGEKLIIEDDAGAGRGAESPSLPSPATFIVDPDNPNASDTENNGVDQPFATLQHGLNQLRPGDTLQVKAFSGTYQASDQQGQIEFQGFHVPFGGKEEEPVTIEGIGDVRPIIDQGVTELGSTPQKVGLFLDCVDHVIIRNLEIRNSNGAGITTSLEGCESSNITIEDSYVHHVYGSDLVAGIRLMATHDVAIRNNIIHSIFSDQSSDTYGYAKTTVEMSSSYTVNGNEIWDVNTGISVRAQGAHHLEGFSVENNLVTPENQGILFEADEGELASFSHISIHNNRLVAGESSIGLDLQQSIAQSYNVCIHNNNLIAATNAVRAGGITNLEIFNNIFNLIEGEIFGLVFPLNSSVVNEVALFDANLYWENINPSWAIAISLDENTPLFSMAEWRAYSNDSSMLQNPDGLAMTVISPLINSDFFADNPGLANLGIDSLGMGSQPNGVDPVCL